MILVMSVFFFCKRKTAYEVRISDWSSDVCSSDLVIIAETREEAEAAIADMMGGAFGGAGAEVVIEEFMTGEEASFFALSDGKDEIGRAPCRERVCQYV